MAKEKFVEHKFNANTLKLVDMNATQLARGRSLAINGADRFKIDAPRHSLADLESALEYAQTHKVCSKTLIQTIEREIRDLHDDLEKERKGKRG